MPIFAKKRLNLPKFTPDCVGLYEEHLRAGGAAETDLTAAAAEATAKHDDADAAFDAEWPTTPAAVPAIKVPCPWHDHLGPVTPRP